MPDSRPIVSVRGPRVTRESPRTTSVAAALAASARPTRATRTQRGARMGDAPASPGAGLPSNVCAKCGDCTVYIPSVAPRETGSPCGYCGCPRAQHRDQSAGAPRRAGGSDAPSSHAESPTLVADEAANGRAGTATHATSPRPPLGVAARAGDGTGSTRASPLKQISESELKKISKNIYKGTEELLAKMQKFRCAERGCNAEAQKPSHGRSSARWCKAHEPPMECAAPGCKKRRDPLKAGCCEEHSKEYAWRLCRMAGCTNLTMPLPDDPALFSFACSREHYAAIAPLVPQGPAGPQCPIENCRRPRAPDKQKPGEYHPGCSKEHSAILNGPRCALPSCKRPLSGDEAGLVGEYCQVACRDNHLICDRKCPEIRALSPDRRLYKSIEKQFFDKWLHQEKAKPQIIAILSILPTPDIGKRYLAYRQTLVDKGARPYKHGGPGNEQRRFHGTGFTCAIGTPTQMGPCQSADCIACQIITKGFLIRKAGAGGFNRFGVGMYFSSVPSKSIDYSDRAQTARQKEPAWGAGYRCMFLCYIAVGKGKKLTAGDQTLAKAPEGYDSVIGEPGGDLNYDEVVVYTDDAALPRYLLILKH